MRVLFHPTPTQERLLLALGKYKFLTTSQLLRLGVAGTNSTLSKAINGKGGKNPKRGLKDYKLIIVEGFAQPVRENGKYKYRKLENFHCLTRKGAKLVAAWLNIEENKVKFPKGDSFFNQNYWHRKYTIDCEIEANYWAKSKGFEVIFSDRDFDKAGSNRSGKGYPKTRILYRESDYIIPDANFVLFNGTDHKLFALELHNQKSAREIVGQLVKHIYALKNGGVGLNYGVNKLHRILNVFVEEAKMKIVMKRVQEMEVFQGLEKFFLFKHLGQVLPQKVQGESGKETTNVCNFYDEWLNFNGQKGNVL